MPEFPDTDSADKYLADLLKEPTAYLFTPRTIVQDWEGSGQFETWTIEGDLDLRGKVYQVQFYSEAGEHGETNVDVWHNGQPVTGYDREADTYRDTWEQNIGLDDVVFDICNMVLSDIYEHRMAAQVKAINDLTDVPRQDKVELAPDPEHTTWS